MDLRGFIGIVFVYACIFCEQQFGLYESRYGQHNQLLTDTFGSYFCWFYCYLYGSQSALSLLSWHFLDCSSFGLGIIGLYFVQRHCYSGCKCQPMDKNSIFWNFSNINSCISSFDGFCSKIFSSETRN